MRALNFLTWLVLLLGASGCADKLREERTFTLPEANVVDFKKFELPAQNRDQTIQLEFSASEPVDVFVFLDKSPESMDDLNNNDRAGVAAGSQRNSTAGNLQVKIPARAKPTVMVAISKPAPKKCEVKLKMTN